MHLIHRHRLWIDNAGVRIALVRWGEADPAKPPALLLHGTGFVGEIWDEIASGLAARYTVYALDRRGHGVSDKPGRYHFADFASDLAAAIETLGLSGIYGIGHSAGATDLLLAARLLPERFSRLFVMEPTVMDPDVDVDADAQLSDQSNAAVRGAQRRQAEFASAAAAFERYRNAPAFAPWSEYALRAYVTHGFAHLPDGGVRLLCSPDVETEILRPIFEAMEQVYRGDDRGNPFGWLREVGCPVRIATAENSWAIYKEMSERASRLIPKATRLSFNGVGHCVAQEAPERLLQALDDFAADRG